MLDFFINIFYLWLIGTIPAFSLVYFFNIKLKRTLPFKNIFLLTISSWITCAIIIPIFTLNINNEDESENKDIKKVVF